MTDLKDRVAAIPYWYHRIELPGGIVTPGWAPLAPDAYRIPKDLTGKRVLDVGAWDGYWTFEALKRGAAEVVAIDDWSDIPNVEVWNGTPQPPGRVQWDTFDLCREAFGYSTAQCQRYTMSVYEVKSRAPFDIVFFFGTLYHLRHPLLALEVLSGICREEMYVESAISNDFSPYLRYEGDDGIGAGYGEKMVMEFYPTTELGRNPTNWWSPTLKCLVHMIASCGWQHVKGWKLVKEPKEAPHCRGFARATRIPEAET